MNNNMYDGVTWKKNLYGLAGNLSHLNALLGRLRRKSYNFYEYYNTLSSFA